VAVGFLAAPDPRGHLALYLALFLAGAVTSLLAAGILSASSPRFVLLCGALLRATLLLRAPALSDDMFRYLWDGRVGARGMSPYAVAPDDPAVSGVDPDLNRRVAHRDVRGVYPPVAQAAFRVFGSRGSVLAWKTFAAAADLSVVALLAGGGGPGAGFAAALYAFHPLPVTESAGEGHVDSLGVALLLACLAHLAHRRRAISGVAFAMSALTKYVCLAAVIPLFRRGRCKFLAAAAVVAAVLWLAASRPGASPLGGLGQYATRWDFNSPAYAAVSLLMDATRLPDAAKDVFVDMKERWRNPPWTQAVFPYFYSGFFARALLAALLAAALLLIPARVRELEPAVSASLAALLLLSPTLYPWYLLWLLPFAARRRDPAFLFLSFAAPLSYALLYPLPGVSRGLVYALEFAPFALLLALKVFRPSSPLRTED
jgi:alpha-1,6-mannosyltransferase